MARRVVFLEFSNFVFFVGVNSYGSQFACCSCSAKTKDGVECAFEELVEKVMYSLGTYDTNM